MNSGKTVFAQLLEHSPYYEFSKCVDGQNRREIRQTDSRHVDLLKSMIESATKWPPVRGRI